MHTLILATHNPGKVRELQSFFTGTDVQVKSLDDVGVTGDVEETGTTFEQNALLKANAAAKATNVPSIADDSGLVVDALPDKLGVYSARFVPGSDTDRCVALLQAMEGKENRTARFVCVIAYADPHTGTTHTFTGTCEGIIGTQMSGSSGFGYDPVFIPTGYTQSFGELGAAVKNNISHRAKAVQQFVEWYKNNK